MTEPQTVGVFDYDGYRNVQFVDAGGIIYPLTVCCQASAKGSMDSIVCRKCYREVDSCFGAAWRKDEWKGRP